MPNIADGIDIVLKDWATDRQKEYIDFINEHKNVSEAAAHFNVTRSTINNSMAGLMAKAAKQGYAPTFDMVHPVPDMYKVKGISTLYDKDGKKSAQWVKSTLDENKALEAIKEFAQALGEEVKGLAPYIPPPPNNDEDLLCVYPMGDPHFGMYAWWAEAGEDFDLNIAEKLTCGAIDRLIGSAPSAKTGLLLNLGDMFHADNQQNTSVSGHQLDVDGRWAKVQQVGLRAMLHCINRLLEKHEQVIFRINKGNHDGHSSYALALMISCYFHNEPRVTVDLSPSVMWYYKFGKVLIASTHGDTIKGKDILGVVAADKPQEWGETIYRYGYLGHVHHSDKKEYAGGMVEYFRTMAAKDAWHAGQGYRAGRDMCAIVLHKDYGEVERHTCDIGRLV